MTVDSLLRSHPAIDIELPARELSVRAAFSTWLPSGALDDWGYALAPFATQRPLKYFDPTEVDQCLSVLEANSGITFGVLAAQSAEVTHAMHSLVGPSPSSRRERIGPFGGPSDFVDFDVVWNPEYQRLVEHALNHLANVLLGVMGKRAGKDYLSMALANRIGHLAKNGFPNLVSGFDSAVRNAVSHGSVTFTPRSVRFTDKKRTAEYSPGEFMDLFDRLRRGCNALSIALCLFVLRNLPRPGAKSRQELPLGLLLLALKGRASHSAFTVDRLFPSRTDDGRAQLNIACTTSLRGREMHRYHSLQVCARVQDLVGFAFRRFAVVMDCARPTDVSVFLDAARLQRARAKHEPIEALKDIIDAELLWYDATGLRGRVERFLMIARSSWIKTRSSITEDLKPQGIRPLRSSYIVRDVENASDGRLRRLHVLAVLTDSDDTSQERLREITRHIVRRTRRRWVRPDNLGITRGMRRRPSYIWVRLHQRDNALRSLDTATSRSEGLLLRAEWIPRSAVHPALFVKQPDETWKGIRFQFE